jgi:hypothetical protein
LSLQVIEEPRISRRSIDRRTPVGLFLFVFGGVTAGVSIFIAVTPVLVLGLASMLLGVMTLFLREPVQKSVERLASELGIPALLNIENLLDDLSLNEKGIYIPATGLAVCPKVFVPLTRTHSNRRPPRNLNNSHKVFVILNEKTGEGGLLLEPPGRNLLSELELTAKLDMSKVDISNLGDKLESNFRLHEISKSLSLERRDEQTVAFRTELDLVSNLEIKLASLTPRLADQVGTIVSSAIAAAVSKSTDRYVTFRNCSISPADRTISAVLELFQ